MLLIQYIIYLFKGFSVEGSNAKVYCICHNYSTGNTFEGEIILPFYNLHTKLVAL